MQSGAHGNGGSQQGGRPTKARGYLRRRQTGDAERKAENLVNVVGREVAVGNGFGAGGDTGFDRLPISVCNAAARQVAASP